MVELGCGSGHNLAVLAARHSALATGIDHDPAKVARAQELYGHIPGLRAIQADAASYLTALPAADPPGHLTMSLRGLVHVQRAPPRHVQTREACTCTLATAPAIVYVSGPPR